MWWVGIDAGLGPSAPPPSLEAVCCLLTPSSGCPLRRQTINCVVRLLGTLVVICLIYPPIILVFAPIMTLYTYVNRYFAATARELKRLDAVTRSPIYAGFSEALEGIPTIRAFAYEVMLLRVRPTWKLTTCTCLPAHTLRAPGPFLRDSWPERPPP